MAHRCPTCPMDGKSPFLCDLRSNHAPNSGGCGTQANVIETGGGLVRIEVDGSFDVTHESDKQLVALNVALDELKRSDSRKAKVVKLRYFGGLSVEETAAIVDVSVETVTRDWRLARGWLLSQIAE